LGEDALGLARAQGVHGDGVWCVQLLGRVALTQGDLQRAEALYREAHAAAAAGGRSPLVAHCHLGLGQVSRQRGERQDAVDHLTTAATMYREMGMTYWLQRAEAQMGAGSRN
jgi:tetratricopeptide (TPR) repeat protein